MHKECLKKIFGVSYLPTLDINLQDIVALAQELIGKLSISGVQPKLSLKLNKENKKLELAKEGGEYILKPQNNTFPYIPENENLCMNIAELLEIEVPSHSLIKLKDGSLAYIVKRFDRSHGNKIHQEDFFQILGKRDKYHGSIEEIGKKLKSVADFPGLQVQLLYARVVVNFLLGNGDAHLKNFSVSYRDNKKIILSPAYDIVSSKLVILNEENTALTINGKKNKLNRDDFLKLADYLNIPHKIANYFYEDKKDLMINLAKQSFLPDNYKNNLTKIISERFQRIANIP